MNGWVRTKDVADELGVRNIASVARQLGIETRYEKPGREVIHEDDVALLRETMELARGNREARAARGDGA